MITIGLSIIGIWCLLAFAIKFVAVLYCKRVAKLREAHKSNDDEINCEFKTNRGFYKDTSNEWFIFPSVSVYSGTRPKGYFCISWKWLFWVYEVNYYYGDIE